jgi:hypothetical protein
LASAEKIPANYNLLAWGWTSFVINADVFAQFGEVGTNKDAKVP